MKKILVFLILIIAILLRFAFSVRTTDIYKDEIYKFKFELNDGRGEILEINDKFPNKKIYTNSLEKENGKYEGYFSIFEKKEYKGITFIGIDEIRSEKIEKNFLENYLMKIFKKSQEDFTPSLKNINRAIVLGDSTRMSEEIKEKIRYIGLSHLFAMSGFHISVIFLIAYFIFSKIFKKKNIIEISILILISLYYLSINSSPSFTRAYIMLVIYLAGKIFYEKINMKKSLWISAIISILYNPSIVFSISFQLSYLAMIAILYIYPSVIESFRKIKTKVKRNKFTDYLILSVIIQLFLAPLVVYYFLTFPFLGMFFNVLLVPIASIYILLNYISLFLANFNLDFLLRFLIEISYKIFICFIEIISRIPYLSLKVENKFLGEKLIYIYLFVGILFYIKYFWREFYERNSKNSKKRM